MTRQAGNFVDFFVQRDSLLQVFELHRAADFGDDGESVWVPLNHDVAELNRIAFVDLHLSAVNYGVALALTALLIDDRNRALAVHHHQIAGFGFNRLQPDEFDGSGRLGFQA